MRRASDVIDTLIPIESLKEPNPVEDTSNHYDRRDNSTFEKSEQTDKEMTAESASAKKELEDKDPANVERSQDSARSKSDPAKQSPEKPTLRPQKGYEEELALHCSCSCAVYCLTNATTIKLEHSAARCSQLGNNGWLSCTSNTSITKGTHEERQRLNSRLDVSASRLSTVSRLRSQRGSIRWKRLHTKQIRQEINS